MDDKEYYSLTNRSSSWFLRNVLSKKSGKNDTSSISQKKENLSYKSLEVRQCSADAQMLLEKKS